MKISKLQYDLLTEIGKIIHKAKSGRLILKLFEESPIKMGDTIVTSHGRKIGIVNELIGSVKSPYASVILADEDFETKSGENVYRFIPKNTKKYFSKGFKKPFRTGNRRHKKRE
ncbi:MAG TPA: Gar1/Naf1 family protein [Nitrososphaeraceae archaeon]|nr:Gar1/Naf1 family protein [Nitrososphaeraceae archaeon]